MPRQIVLLSDGQVGNEAQLIELATQHAARCRIFTFGIGHGASEHLVRGLARASGGQSEFIHPNERIEPKVLRQFARMASASLTNVRVDWGTLKTDLVAPSETPQLFDRDRLTLYGRVIGGVSCEVAVLADSPQGALRFPVRVDLEQVAAESAIPVLMARKAIQELEEGRAAARGSAQANRKPNAQRAKILELALRYQLMSSATSFVAIEERAADASAQQPAELRRIPVALTKGWGALDQAAAGAAPMAMVGGAAMYPTMLAAPAPAMSRVRKAAGAARSAPPPPPPASPAPAQSGAGVFGAIGRALFGVATANEPAMEPEVTRGQHIRGAVTHEVDTLLALTTAQRADGSFEPNDALLSVLKINRGKLEFAAKSLGGDESLALRVVTTFAAIQTLESKFADRRDEWKMLADKAERWLAKQNVTVPKGFSDLKAWAKSELKLG